VTESAEQFHALENQMSDLVGLNRRMCDSVDAIGTITIGAQEQAIVSIVGRLQDLVDISDGATGQAAELDAVSGKLATSARKLHAIVNTFAF